MTPAEQLARGLNALNLDLPGAAHKKLLAYIALLYKWNKTYSLTALREQEQAISHHLLDSLAILPFVPPGRLLDVGSGGGMPGIPLAIACPDLAVCLLDSNSKKSAFLQQALIDLSLKNAAVHCGRVEHYQPPESFHAITARAFAALPDLVNGSTHLLAADGVWLAMKGLCPDDEIAHLPASARRKATHRLQVPGVDGERHLIILEKRPEEAKK